MFAGLGEKIEDGIVVSDFTLTYHFRLSNKLPDDASNIKIYILYSDVSGAAMDYETYTFPGPLPSHLTKSIDGRSEVRKDQEYYLTEFIRAFPNSVSGLNCRPGAAHFEPTNQSQTHRSASCEFCDTIGPLAAEPAPVSDHERLSMSEYVLPQVMESRRHASTVQELLHLTYPEITVDPSETAALGPADIVFIVSFRGKKGKLFVPDTIFMEHDPSDSLLEDLGNQLPQLFT